MVLDLAASGKAGSAVTLSVTGKTHLGLGQSIKPQKNTDMRNLVVVRNDCLPSSPHVEGSSVVAADVAQGVVYMAIAQPSLAVMCISTDTPQVRDT